MGAAVKLGFFSYFAPLKPRCILWSSASYTPKNTVCLSGPGQMKSGMRECTICVLRLWSACWSLYQMDLKIEAKEVPPTPALTKHSHFILKNILTDSAKGTVHLNPSRKQKTMGKWSLISTPNLKHPPTDIAVPMADFSLFTFIIFYCTRFKVQWEIAFSLLPVCILVWVLWLSRDLVNAVVQNPLWDFLSSYPSAWIWMEKKSSSRA